VSAPPQVLRHRFRNGRWEALLRHPGGAPPAVEALWADRPLPGLELQPDGEDGALWHLRLPIPAEAISEGMQTFLLRRPETGETLCRFALLAGRALEEDVMAELAFLRADLDLLKQVVRRLMAERERPGDGAD
jgi:hypothetical protein